MHISICVTKHDQLALYSGMTCQALDTEAIASSRLLLCFFNILKVTVAVLPNLKQKLLHTHTVL